MLSIFSLPLCLIPSGDISPQDRLKPTNTLHTALLFSSLKASFCLDLANDFFWFVSFNEAFGTVLFHLLEWKAFFFFLSIVLTVSWLILRIKNQRKKWNLKSLCSRKD